ncbi:uncharacterized protein LOC142340645 [Convolutriloba macropyga]|uniref:uncharacterized protein LOC142340645 n=1 Tax=Convolutriloba macropyga TaxID=536237 RepID=UPI003F526C48
MASEAIDVDQKFTQQTLPPEIVVNGGKAQTGKDAEVEGGTSAVGGTGGEGVGVVTVASKWIIGIAMTLGLVAVGASVGVYFAVDNMNSDNVEWQDTIFATIERGCRDSAGNWRNMERREGQVERHEGHFFMGNTAWMGETGGIVTTDICVHQGDNYYMVEWGDGVTSSSEMSRDHGNRIVEVYTTENIYRVFDIKDDSGSYCMIESIHWEELTGTPSTAAEARKFDLEEISALLNSLSDVDNLRNRISYLMTYVPPDPFAPGVDLGDSDLGIPGFPEDLGGGDAGWYNPSDSWFVPGDSGGNIGGVDLSIDALLMQQAELMADMNMDSFPHYTDEERQRETKQKHRQPGKEDWVDEARRNGKRSGRGGKDGRTARNATGNGTELAKTRVVNGRRDGRDGTAERATHEETGNETDRTEALSE